MPLSRTLRIYWVLTMIVSAASSATKRFGVVVTLANNATVERKSVNQQMCRLRGVNPEELPAPRTHIRQVAKDQTWEERTFAGFRSRS